MANTDEIRALIEKLSEASFYYYEKNSEIMSDREYDGLYDRLEALERETGIIYSDSPTQNVGYTVLDKLQKVRHESRVLSLDKTKETEKLADFLGNETGMLSWKLDGLTVVLKYQNGELVQALTRGNGEIGENVTHNALVFINLPQTIPFKGKLSIRGESLITYSQFEIINSKLPPEEQYKNPRNLCSGTVRQLNSEICAMRRVKYCAYTLISADGIQFSKKSEALDWLARQGFEIVFFELADKNTVADAVARFSSKVSTNDFGSDGLVLTYDDIPYSESLGATSKFPKHTIAFKWADELCETTLRNISWNTSRTGAINPVAEFDPVELEGTIVSRASLHNISIIENLSLGIDDKILVYKANMIIPQIAENLTKSGVFQIPGFCPVCGIPTIIIKEDVSKILYCPNPNCSAQLAGLLVHFSQRDAMNIEGLSDSTIEKFVEQKYLKNYFDIFLLSEHEHEIKSLPGFGTRSVDKLLERIEASKQTELYRFIYALGIKRVGLVAAKLICAHFDNDLDKIISASEADFLEIDQLGEIISKTLFEYFKNPSNLAMIEKSRSILSFVSPNQGDSTLLSGMTFVITGDLKHFDNRGELVTEIEANGGKTSSSVSAKTSFLINNDANSSSSKNKKARELGVEIITEEEFILRLSNNAFQSN